MRLSCKVTCQRKFSPCFGHASVWRVVHTAQRFKLLAPVEVSSTRVCLAALFLAHSLHQRFHAGQACPDRY